MLFPVVPNYLDKKKNFDYFWNNMEQQGGKVMKETFYTARRVKPQNRNTWTIEFRHPRIKEEKTGKYGKKIRRSLGTTNEAEATRLVEQMNTLLSTVTYWNISSKLLAENKFNIDIVNAFYDGIEQCIIDYDKIRDEKIPIKKPKDGYSRVLLLGATGAGKTTLLRQIMGTDPIKERFPATSTAKTTVFDSEIIFSEGNYSAVVTFYTESETRELVKDSIRNAMYKFYLTDNEKDTLRVLLEDEDMRFRLSYILGKPKENKRFAKYENQISDDSKAVTDFNVTEEEQKAFEEKILYLLEQIKLVTKKIIVKNTSEYKPNKSWSDEEKNIFEEIIVSEIMDYDEVELWDLTDYIIEEIKERFKSLEPSELEIKNFGWPNYWYKTTEDRDIFIKSIRFFSSNSSYAFGKLLTPLVSGMRIQGPFKPEFLPNIPKLVILDGEGLGHIPDTTSNLPSKTISKFDDADAIILVDDAQSPMLAPPYAVLKTVATNGHYEKLFICFTHFDLVKGDNLPSIQDKVDHITGAVDSILANLESILTYEVKKYLSNHINQSSFFLSNLDERFTSDQKFTFSRDELCNLIKKMENKRFPVAISDAIPIYDISTILFKIQSASKGFHEIWHSHLFGKNATPIIKKEHFTRIKALSRRLGYHNMHEYDSLRPISDFSTILNKYISNFLSSPSMWVPSNPTEEEKVRKIVEITQKMSTKIHKYSIDILKNKSLIEWQEAYNYSGRGSADTRANKIESIYYNRIPIVSGEMDNIEKQFVNDIIDIIKRTINECGGSIDSIYNP